jgi:hypothetical protein
MKTYRDYLDRKEVPRGPWCILELNNPVVKPEKVVYNDGVSEESQPCSKLT